MSGKVAGLILASGALLIAVPAHAGVTVSPYVSVKSTKSIKATKDKSKENETTKQRTEAGMRGAISFWRVFKLQASLGQSKLTTTQKTQDAKDEYGEIDYEKDLNMSTDDPAAEIKITETQNNGKVSLVLDPSFWIFIMRAKAGVTARQRILESEVTGAEQVTTDTGIKYRAHSGFGAGVRLGRTMSFMMEYNFEHYKYPEIEPFEREVAVSFSVDI